jgi:hypothetical protein
VGLRLIQGRSNVAKMTIMFGHQMVNLMMDSTPLGGKGHVEVIDLFNRSNWQCSATDSAAVECTRQMVTRKRVITKRAGVHLLVWPLDFKASCQNKPPR